MSYLVRESYEYNNDCINRNDSFMSEDCLSFVSALLNHLGERNKTCAFYKGGYWPERSLVLTDM